MHCIECNIELREGAKYCESCGVMQMRACPACNFEMSPAAKFCTECGTRLSPAESGSEPNSKQQAPRRRQEIPAQTAERRQLTVMFCDLVDSTVLSTRVDPEDLRELVKSYQAAACKPIELQGGHVAQYLGDGILAYFGYPTAFEDGAARAIRAGLGIVDEMRQLNRRLSRELNLQLDVRIGLHTGPVVIGDIGGGARTERLALGDTPNIAARLESQASANTLCISEATANMVRSGFDLESMGKQRLKGVSRPMETFRVLGERDSLVDEPQHQVAMVNRDLERRLLLECWSRVSDNEGSAVVLSGQAGIGKSRLVDFLLESLPREGVRQIKFGCSSLHEGTAFHPFVNQLRRTAGFADNDPPEARLEALKSMLESCSGALIEELPILASLLSLPTSQEVRDLAPPELKERAQQALLKWMLSESESKATVLIFEDLHWMDPSSMEVLKMVQEEVSQSALFLVMTFRSDFDLPRDARPLERLVRIEINRLAPVYVRELIGNISGGKELPANIGEQLVDRVDGVPVFVEELTRSVLESSQLSETERAYEYVGNPDEALAIPATLRDTLMARLDRLSSSKSLVQMAATLGRECTYHDLLELSELNEEVLRKFLLELDKAEILIGTGTPPEARYTFRHALLQEEAYDTLLKSVRQDYHLKIGNILEQRYRTGASAEDGNLAPLLAHHWSNAFSPSRPEQDVVVKAIEYLILAGECDLRLSAYREASTDLARALQLSELLDSGELRDELELAIRVHQATVLKATVGWGSDEVRDGFEHCRELCLRLGDRPELGPVLIGLWGNYCFRAKYVRALELAVECLKLAEQVDSSDLRMHAHAALANSHFWLGNMNEAMANADLALETYEPAVHAEHAVRYGLDPGVFGYMFAVWSPWLLGLPETALVRHRELLEFSQKLDHPFSMALALNTSCCYYINQQDPSAALEAAERLIDLSRQCGLPVYEIFGILFRGWALARFGQGDDVIDEVSETYRMYFDKIGGIAQTYAAILMAEACLQTGRYSLGLETLDGALEVALAEDCQEQAYHAELVRLKAEITAHSLGPAEAEPLMREALALAQARRQPPLSLRAAMGIFRIAEQTGRGMDDARRLIAGEIEKFPEKKGSADLEQASGLLGRLVPHAKPA